MQTIPISWDSRPLLIIFAVMILTQNLFSTDSKFADVLDRNPMILDILSRMGIRLGFGEATLAEVCSANALDPDTFCLICNVYTFEDFTPSAWDISQGRITDVVRYLRSSHTYYLTTELVNLEKSIENLMRPCSEKQQKVIWKFFTDYREELQKHFAYEESEVMPYVQDLLFGRDTRGYTIDRFEENHGNVDEKLSDLKNLVMKSLPSECDDRLTSQLVRDIIHLQKDLACHTRVEDMLLTPMARFLEHPQAFSHEISGAGTEKDGLSDREKDILVSVAKGMINKEIADEYNISIHTVISHRKNITRKTGIKTVAGLTVYALLNGLIDINTVE